MRTKISHMTTQITLPNLGENIESGDVLSILVSEGDMVAVEQDLIEIETDKATLPVPSPHAGKIVKLLVSEGDTIVAGAVILELEEAEATAKPVEEKTTTGEAASAAAAAAAGAAGGVSDWGGSGSGAGEGAAAVSVSSSSKIAAPTTIVSPSLTSSLTIFPA